MELPMASQATRLVGTLTNGRAIVACGDEVYVITLPQAVTHSDERLNEGCF